ncbi:hypothetical protein PWT90_09374 [Aphanocladium album]|nr:hypothetical protein PWT90_09374 [Aphanocladium album]
MVPGSQLVWEAYNFERSYAQEKGWIIKRQLRDDELPESKDGQLIRPLWDEARLRNEYETTRFIREYTPIPVPECKFYQEDSLWHFASKMIPGAVSLEDISDTVKVGAAAAVREQIVRFVLPHLCEFTRDHIGSVSTTVPVFPPARIYRRDDRTWETITSPRKEFVLCHNDLSPENIWIHPVTWKITAIIGWEYAGYFPPDFELPLWTASGWDTRLAMHNHALERDLGFFKLSKDDLKNSTPLPVEVEKAVSDSPWRAAGVFQTAQ